MSAAPRPLVDQIALLIERTYAVRSGVVPLGPFIVGDEGFARLTERHEPCTSVEHTGDGARLLLRRLEVAEGWAAALYLPDGLVAHLEAHDPRRAVTDGNVDAFATLVEEIDHIVTFSDRVVRRREAVSLLELEWHAAVTKYLVLGHFLGRLTGRPRLGARERQFVEHHLFHKGRYSDPDAAVRARYRDATRLAVRFVRRLAALRPRERLLRLRRFHRASHHEKLRVYA